MVKYYETSAADVRIRTAEPEDAPLILELIRGLAVYEKMQDEVYVTEDLLRENLFEKKQAEVLIAEYRGKAIGYALFFPTFSTFLGTANLYLEDIFVMPEARGLGAGKALLACFAKIAVERKAGKAEWTVLNWNEPSIRFYTQMGARLLEEWSLCRMDRKALSGLAEKL
ncbi:MAG TPA: GNAT family N-acetyltransferase [Anaerovoracaceae bacterium]|nr:GNAT family N-acetyltransferase [Anaerovoracaceae bacterium]